MTLVTLILNTIMNFLLVNIQMTMLSKYSITLVEDEQIYEEIMDWNNQSVEVEDDPLNEAMAITDDDELEFQFSLDYSTEYIY